MFLESPSVLNVLMRFKRFISLFNFTIFLIYLGENYTFNLRIKYFSAIRLDACSVVSFLPNIKERSDKLASKIGKSEVDSSLYNLWM